MVFKKNLCRCALDESSLSIGGSIMHCLHHLVNDISTALFYLSSAYNPKSSDYVRKKYKKKLMKFEEQCELIKYLGDNMTIRYKDPRDRPIDFDFKLQQFLALQGEDPTPTTTWIS